MSRWVAVVFTLRLFLVTGRDGEQVIPFIFPKAVFLCMCEAAWCRYDSA